MKLLFVSLKVESRIAGLKKAGKSGKILAQKATDIIDSLASGEVLHHLDAVVSYTKYGEERIKNCYKYDLGCSYRLIVLQRGKNVLVPFLGSHDEYQRWLENNSRLKAFNAGKGRRFISKTGHHPKNLGTLTIWIWMKIPMAFCRI